VLNYNNFAEQVWQNYVLCLSTKDGQFIGMNIVPTIIEGSIFHFLDQKDDLGPTLYVIDDRYQSIKLLSLRYQVCICRGKIQLSLDSDLIFCLTGQNFPSVSRFQVQPDRQTLYIYENPNIGRPKLYKVSFPSQLYDMKLRNNRTNVFLKKGNVHVYIGGCTFDLNSQLLSSRAPSIITLSNI